MNPPRSNSRQKQGDPPLPGNPTILPRAEHNISRKLIDPDTLKVMKRLRSHGYQAFLVGGSVRDLLLSRTPKDFDVSTDATPGQIRKLFRNCYLVGRRFRLAHIRFGADKVVEVATFRRQAREEELPEDSRDRMMVAENIFGSPEEDAFRRDITINSLFYDLGTFSVIDYAGGLEDLNKRRIRVIGDPLVRFTEDPVRMLRALEFAARLGFTLDESVREGIYQRAPMIAEAAPARLREELLELFRHRVAGAVLREAQAMGLLSHLLAGFEGDLQTFRLLEEVDRFIAAGNEVEEPLVLAALNLSRFWRAIQNNADLHVSDAARYAGLILDPLCQYFRVASKIRHLAREFLVACFRFQRGPGQRGERRFLRHPLTPPALDLFRLWTRASGESEIMVAAWAQALQDPESPPQPSPARRPRRRRRKTRRHPTP